MPRKLPRSFYARSTLTVAKELLGKTLVSRVGGQRLAGKIVETEAYMGPKDVASHSKHGPESRAAPMFGDPGHAYVYFTYGMHHCINVVTEPAGSGTAVLIRALEPADGLPAMRRNRGPNIDDRNLTNGPGKLCQALGITRGLNLADLLGDSLWIEEAPAVSPRKIKSSARVGISRGREHSWRFYVDENPYVSAHPRY